MKECRHKVRGSLMEPVHASYFPYKSHPGGDDIPPRLLSIIRIALSNAGYSYRYPYISDVPHRGTLTRPETLASPVFRAYRHRHQERLGRLPSLGKTRPPASPTLPVVMTQRSDHRDGRAVCMAMDILPESVINNPTTNPISTPTAVNASPFNQDQRHDDCTQTDAVTETDETKESGEAEDKDVHSTSGIPSAYGRPAVRNRTTHLLTRLHSQFLKSFRRGKNTCHNSENKSVKEIFESKDGQEDEKDEGAETKETPVKDKKGKNSEKQRRGVALPRMASRLRRQLRKIFS